MIRNGQFRVGIRIFPEIRTCLYRLQYTEADLEGFRIFLQKYYRNKRRESVIPEVAHGKSEGQKEKYSSNFYWLKKQ